MEIKAKEPSVIDWIYFTWSILHLLLRAILTILTTSSVYQASHAPLTFIQDQVSMDNYSLEVQRFERKLKSESLGLTGYGCFVMRRGVFLGVCSSLINSCRVEINQFDFSLLDGIIDLHSVVVLPSICGDANSPSCLNKLMKWAKVYLFSYLGSKKIPSLEIRSPYIGKTAT